MAQSYRSRLDGQLQEFIDVAQKYDIWEAMRRFDLKDYIRARKLGIEETNDDNFGLHGTTRSYLNQGIQGLLREFVVAFGDYAIRMQKQNGELKRELEAYKVNGEQLEHQFADGLIGIMEALKAEGG